MERHLFPEQHPYSPDPHNPEQRPYDGRPSDTAATRAATGADGGGGAYLMPAGFSPGRRRP
jgi:hypothetical protein